MSLPAGSIKLPADQRQRHRRERVNMGSAALHPVGRDFEPGRAIVIHNFLHREPGNLARPHSGQEQKPQRLRDRRAGVERAPQHADFVG